MTKLDQLIQTHCPNGVEYKSIQETVGLNRGRRLTKSQLSENGKYEVYHGSKDTILGKYEKSNAPAGTVIVVNTGGIGGVKYLSEPFWCSDGSFWLGQHDDINSKYLYYCLVRYEDYFASQKREGGVPTIDRCVVENFKIPVPPIPVQEEIVRILDKFTELEAELAQELAQELAHRKQQYAFYRDRLLSFESPIVTKTIGEICAIKRGKVISKDYIREHSGVYPVYSSQTENDGVLGLIDSYDYDGEYLTWTTDGANAGTVFHRTGKFNITNVCGLLKPIDASVNARYLYYILGNIAGRYVEKGMGNPKLMSNVMEKIKIPVPSLDVQQRLVNVLDNFDAICSDLSIGLPAEIAARKKAYVYYRDFLLNYTANGLDLSRAEQSRAEQSRAEQSRAEQSRAEQKLIAYVFGPRKCA